MKGRKYMNTRNWKYYSTKDSTHMQKELALISEGDLTSSLTSFKVVWDDSKQDNCVPYELKPRRRLCMSKMLIA